VLFLCLEEFSVVEHSIKGDDMSYIDVVDISSLNRQECTET
jgi:hypothetical protein